MDMYKNMNIMENISPASVAEDIIKSVKQEYSNLNRLNVLILGKTGVGKSTLINRVFNENLAATGTGKPITANIRPLGKKGFPLTIYDTPGLELSGRNSVDGLIKDVKTLIHKGITSGSVNEAIHCVWYCIGTPTHRIEPTEIFFLKSFLTAAMTCSVPVIIVLTQSYSKRDARELAEEIRKENLSVAQIVPVLAQDYELDEDTVIKAYGLSQLTEIMYQLIPEAVRNTFASVQKASIDIKKREAQAVVANSARLAAVTGAVPIPIPDAAVLVPEQIAMLAKITAVFGVPMQKATITAILSSMIGTASTTTAGRAIVTSLLKLIPGAGSVVGGAISAATASALTAALGEAYIVVMIRITTGEFPISKLNTPEGKRELAGIFKEKLALKRNKEGKTLE